MNFPQNVSSSVGTVPDTLASVLRMRSLTSPDRPAYRFLSGRDQVEEVVTCSQLDTRARTIAGFLQNHGATGHRVILLYPPGLEYIAAFMGCLYAGRIAVPLYPPRVNQKFSRIAAVVQDCGAQIALTASETRPQIASFLESQGDLQHLTLFATNELEESLADLWSPPILADSHLAFLQYTSGSTGKPKGVMVSHGNLIANEHAIATAFNTGQEDRCFSWLPLYHDMGLIGTVLQALYRGFELILMAPIDFIRNPISWLQAISRYRISLSGGPNFAYDLVVQRLTPDMLSGLDLRSWRVAFNGAEPIRAATLRRFAAALAPAGFDIHSFYPCYGMAETTLFLAGSVPGSPLTLFRADKRDLAMNRATRDEGEEALELVGCGTTWTGHRLKIVDPVTLQACPDRQVGEIWASGPSVTMGYWNNRELTRTQFQACLADTGEGPYLRTGDLGYLSENQLFICGRLKDLIIIRGRNYHPSDIEEVVARAHDLLPIDGCAAFSVPVDDEERLVILSEIARKSRGNLNSQTITPAIRAEVARVFELQAHAVLLIKPGSLPKTSSGKVRRSACREAFLAGELQILAEDRTESVSAPEEQNLNRGLLLALPVAQRSGTLLAYLRQLTAAYTGVPIGRLSPETNLATLGLDSIALIAVQHQLESQLGVHIRISQFLEGISLTQLARLILEQLSLAPVQNLAILSGSETPISHNQKALYFLHCLDPQSTAYHLSFAANLPQDVNVERLGQAIAGLFERHPILTTTFHLVDGEPVQRLASSCPARGLLRLNLNDTSSLSELELQEVLAGCARQPFQLDRDPMLRADLFQGSGETILLLTAQHIALDMWSFLILMDELAQEYEGNPPQKCQTTYRDFVDWQRALLQSEWGGKLEEYWRANLAGAPMLTLPLDRNRPARQGFRGATHHFQLPPDLARSIEQLAATRGTTLYTFLLTAFQVLLYRYSNQNDLVIGSPNAGRSRAEFADVVGFFVNTMALRSGLSSSDSFGELLERTKKVVLDGLTHGDQPFQRLVELLVPDRHPAIPPLVQVMFSLQRPHRNEALLPFISGRPGVATRLGCLEARTRALPQESAQVDLSLLVTPDPSGYLFSRFEYNTDLFESQSIKFLARHFENLLWAVITRPGEQLDHFELLTAPQRQQLLNAWNQTGDIKIEQGRLSDLFHNAAIRVPNRLAIVAGQNQLDYTSLQRRVETLAAQLARKGAGPEQLIGLYLPRCLEMVVAILAVLETGAAYLPLDPSHPADRIMQILEDARPCILVTQGSLPGIEADLPPIHDLLSPDTTNPPWKRPPGHAQNAAYVLFTSGSTGRPKGVCITHENVMSLLHAFETMAPSPDHPICTSVCPFGFDVSVWELFTALTRGGTLYLPDREVIRDPRLFADYLVAHAISQAYIPPGLLEPVLISLTESRGKCALSLLLTGVEPIQLDLLQGYRQLIDGIAVINAYGPTETTVCSTGFLVSGFSGANKRTPIGAALPGERVYLASRELDPAPPGLSGEILIGGAGLGRGYHHEPGKTAQRFIPDPFSQIPGSRLYKTGDRARMRPAEKGSGPLVFLGRIDRQLKFRGFRIEPAEVENALTAIEWVVEAAVQIVDDSQQKSWLVAFIVARPDQVNDPGSILELLAAKLPPYMVPNRCVFLPHLPRTANGKIDRVLLAATSLANKPEQGVKAPTTATEQSLAGIWCQLLGLKQVGVDQNFFSLGGHSLSAIQMVQQIRSLLAKDLPLTAVFSGPTISQIARKLDLADGPGETHPDFKNIPPTSTPDISLAQQRLWLQLQLEGNSAAYNISGALQLKGNLDLLALEKSLTTICSRHSVLRSYFLNEGGTPRLVLFPVEKFGLTFIDGSHLEGDCARSLGQALLNREFARPFDISCEFLVRAHLYRLDANTHLLFLVMHHIVSDGWSMKLLIDELSALYTSYAQGHDNPLLPLPIHYSDFAQWQRDTLKGDYLQGLELYWKEQLANLPARLNLSFARSDSAPPSLQAGCFAFELDGKTRSAFLQLARQEGVTLFTLLFSLFNILLTFYSGARDLVIGINMANRNHPQVHPLIGFFMNQLPIRTRLAGSSCFRDLMQRIHEQLIGAQAHQDLPFDLLLNALKIKRGLDATPLFQVKFGLFDLETDKEGLAGLQLTNITPEETLSKFEMALNFENAQSGLKGRLLYQERVFDRKSVETFAAQFQALANLIGQQVDLSLEETYQFLAGREALSKQTAKQKLEESSRLRLKKRLRS